MAHQLKIVLKDTDPKIYRTVIVPENYSFYQLHIVIQSVMNWQNCHLFEFNLGTPYASDSIGLLNDDDDDDDFWGSRSKKYDAEETYLSDFFNGQVKKMNYTYDFGDDWRHVITVLKKPKEEVLYPKCIKGENVAPIEDCGGIWGFYELVGIMNKSRKTATEREKLEWYDLPKRTSYEYEFKFDIDETNQFLLDNF
jgi:hypothetical protein